MSTDNDEKTSLDDIQKIKRFLEDKELIYQELENLLIVPYAIGDLTFNPEIQFHGKWLAVSALIVKREAIPDEAFNDLMHHLLLANHNLPEITFDMDEEGNVYTSVDMRVAITDYDNFFSEFFAIPYGIKHFIEKVAPKFNIPVTQL